MQCEWRLKRGKGGPQGRINYLSQYILDNHVWTSKSPNICDQNLTLYIDEEFKKNYNKLNDTNFIRKELYWKE